MRFKVIVLAIVCLCTVSQAHADEASKRAKIEEMFTILNMDSLIKQMMTQGVEQGRQTVKAIVGDASITPADQKIMDDSNAKIIAVLSEGLSWEKLKPAYVDLYASAYSEEEIDGIVTFYKSKIGQALLAKTPELVTKSGVIVRGRMQELGPHVQEILVELQKEIKAAHPAAAAK